MSQRTAATILQDLIRFDTTNPPGNERPCIEYIDGVLRDAGIETSILAVDPQRPNLVARLPGTGAAPGLLLFGHVDVVTTANQQWSVPPFEGRIQDGYIWGRGALDMKAGVAMMMAALLEARATGLQPSGDILFAAVSDEEAGGTMGAKYLVNEHPSLFEGIRYALGEFGGFPVHIDGRPLYMIQVSEKQPCWLKATIRGPAGHSARLMRNGAMARLGHVLSRLNRCRLPIHITPVTERMVRAMADALPVHKRVLFRRLLNPRLTDRILKLLGDTGRNLEPLFRNTVNATMVRGGEGSNVIPSEIALGLDGRLLPGFGPQDLFAELGAALGEDLDYEVLLYDRGTTEIDFGLFPLLADVLSRAHPDSHQIPYLFPGGTDGRFFSQLGIQSYGFIPMNLPASFGFSDFVHGADERIPIESMEFGAKAMFEVMTHFGEVP
ncbi:M20/M25/M40 family metallo-hydrolase [Candidatus Bipolaricaulota bacterium]